MLLRCSPLALLGALLLTACSSSTSYSSPSPSAPTEVLFDETFDVRSGRDLIVDLGSENVTVRTVSGTRARVTVEGRGRDAESEFERKRFSARESRGNLTVRTNPPRTSRGGRRVVARFQVTIEIPRRYSANIDLGSGNVDVASLEGDLTVDVGSGNVNVEDVDGDRIVLDTGSGNVRAELLRGNVRIDTGSGNVEVDRVEGELSVDTGSGNVEVGLHSNTASRIDTGSGGATVRLPRGADLDIDLDGSSVRIDDGLGFSGDQERDRARGRIGRGGPTLRVNTGSGTIRLVRA
ncbi:DUF4097 family beta strand repeat-containing protein [Rubrivirga sp.]|uniref:DUF4097 family beta strand repeat-containing protein n=1 Tax=Rubrivirga sp. TaxID=1885344 RepID=UPI003C71F472